MKIIYEPKGRALEYAALAANIYSGCSHRCEYCFAPNVLHRDKEKYHSEVSVRKGALAQLAKDVAKIEGDNRRVLMSFTTDPYQECEKELGVTRQAIMAIKKAGLNLEILTKGGSLVSRDFDLLDENDCIAVTLTCNNDEDSLKWEPGAALPEERMKVLQDAKERGIATWASLEPVLYPEQTLDIIRKTESYVDLFKVGKLNYHSHAKTIDWKKFGEDAISLLNELGANYYIKMDLRGCMDM